MKEGQSKETNKSDNLNDIKKDGSSNNDNNGYKDPIVKPISHGKNSKLSSLLK